MGTSLKTNKRFQADPEGYTLAMGFKVDRKSGDLTMPMRTGLTCLSLKDYWERKGRRVSA